MHRAIHLQAAAYSCILFSTILDTQHPSHHTKLQGPDSVHRAAYLEVQVVWRRHFAQVF